MMTTSFEDIFNDEMIEEALTDLEGKRDSCGVDGVYLSQLREYWEINSDDILEMLLKETYEPGIIREVEIINNKGKRRIISLYNSLDRLILRCISQKLQQECDELFEDHCFAFRNNLGVEAAVKTASDYMDEGFTWLVKVDISSYYDCISIERLEEMLSKYLPDSRLRRLISKYLHPEVEKEDGTFYYKRFGIVQGSPLSPFLSNLYLTPLDRELAIKDIRY